MKRIYNRLLKDYRRSSTASIEEWWPNSGKFRPKELEICIGAILVQNTNWKNSEKAIQNLIKANALDAKTIGDMRIGRLENLVRPSGVYRQKARRLKNFCRFVDEFDGNFYTDVTREQLLGLNGIGPETADAILLYACNRPSFIIDAYTRRMLARMRMITGGEKYDELKSMFESRLPSDAALYRQFHALIIESEKARKKSA